MQAPRSTPRGAATPRAAVTSSLLGPHLERRILSFEYLQRTLALEHHWLSVVSLPPKEQTTKSSDDAQGLRWYCLGVSIAAIEKLQSASAAALVKALLQLFEEYNFHFGRAVQVVQSVRRAIRHRVRESVRESVGRSAATSSASAEDDFAVALHRVNGEVLYLYLLTPHVPHALSAPVVLQCFCELMPTVYRRLLGAAEGATGPLCDAMLRLDGLIEEHFLLPVSKQLNAAATVAVRSSLGKTDALFSKVLAAASGEERSLGAESQSL